MTQEPSMVVVTKFFMAANGTVDPEGEKEIQVIFLFAARGAATCTAEHMIWMRQKWQACEC